MAKKETAKKAAAPKPSKIAKPKKSTAKFVSFSVRAVIPTQSYGNVQPEITVSAATYEEARDFALPHIEALYKHYAEVKPGFLGRIEVKEVVVGPLVETPAAPQAVDVPAPVATDPVQPQATSQAMPEGPKPEPVIKAEKAIANCASEAAAVVIQGQIEKSEKIPAEYKPALLTQMLKKRGEFK